MPLIAQPYVVQGFEDLLPYERFSSRLEFDQVPRLPAMLLARGLSQMARRLLHTAPLRDQCVPPSPQSLWRLLTREPRPSGACVVCAH